MATTKRDAVTRNIAPKSLFESAKQLISTSTSFNQGDMLAMDTTNHVIIPVAADADSKVLLGVARVSVSSGKLVGPYTGLTAVDAAVGISDIPGPVFGVEVEMILNTGDAINPGDPVYIKPSVDAQTVTATDSGANSEVIGVYNGAAIASAAAGQKIKFVIGARYPENVLKY